VDSPSRPFLPESRALSNLTLSQGLDAFLLALRVQGRSPQTLDLYERSIKPLIAFLGDPPVEVVTTGDLRRYLACLGERVKPTTVGIRWRSIRAYFNWLYEEGWLKESPTARIKPPKTPKEFPNVLTPTEVRALVQTAKRRARGSPWEGYRDYCLVMVLLDTGIRRGEAQGLAVHDLSLQHQALTVTGKTGERTVFYGRRTARVLREWLGRRTLRLPGDALFCRRDGYPLEAAYVSKIVAKLAKAAGLRRIGCHTLRHTFATTFITQGGDVFALQRLLGHSSIEVTRVYVDLGHSELREAHAKASPVDRLLGGS